MRLVTLGGGALLLAACASSPTADNSQPLERACSVDNCFQQRDVRDFEVIDPTTLVVYVGSQRCAFKIDLRGTFCDMTFAPQVYFRSPNDFERTDQRDLFGNTAGSRQLGDLRICSNDIGISVDGGVFTEPVQSTQPVDRFGNRRSECQLTSVESLTDDELVELYVARGLVPPPPPMGQGEIEVGEQSSPEPSAPSGEAAAGGGAGEPSAPEAAAQAAAAPN